MRIATLTLAGTAAAQSLGSIPYGVQAPSSAGLDNATLSISRGGLAVCVSGSVPVTASTSHNLKFNFSLPQTQVEVTQTFLEDVTAGSPFTQELVKGTQSVNGTYSIAVTLCTPANDTKPKAVQLLAHGLGFDRYYWDFAPGYSYVDAAVANGYAAFFYDRLGVGESEKADAIDVVQAPLEVNIAHVLAVRLREGCFGNTSFSTVIGVGHSFGSIITQAVTSQFPSDLDAAILTGFSVNSSAIGVFTTGLNLALANQNQPLRFQNLTNGYLVSDTVISNQIGFFHWPGFDPAILYLSETTKGTITFGELFTTAAVTAPALNYTKPVAVVDGVEDLPFCFGNCTYPHNLAQAVQPALYPKVTGSKFGTYLAPTTGHGLNLHYGAAAAYEYIESFLKSNGV